MTCTLGSLSASIFGGSASIELLVCTSDGLRSMCVGASHKSSKVRTYTKTSVYILLKNDATDRCRWCATSRGVTRLDKSIITDYRYLVKRFIVRLPHPNPSEFRQYEPWFRGFAWGRSSFPVRRSDAL